MAAILISLANVGVSSVLGYYSRFVNSAKFLAKLWGLVLILAWVVLISAFNLAVAHFRDAVQTIGDWSLAATAATNTLLDETLGISSIESWLLIVLGGLISLLAFMKAYYADDPYPSYGNYARSLSNARNEYTDALVVALGQLEMRRDDATEELKEADQFVSRELSEAIDALYGQSSLQSHLTNFLEQCDHTARQLLKQYRDINSAERTSNAPDYFDKVFALAEFVEHRQDNSLHRDRALKEQERVAELVDRACEDINQEYFRSLGKFKSIPELQNELKAGPSSASGDRQASGAE